MDTEIKVSVIIPVYNEEQYLAQCLSSVLCQTLREIEIICVDDGSTDGSLQILESFAAEDDRITILRQENQYAGCARNLGMEKARGRYLVFWDSDDYFEETALEKMYAACERDEADICVTNAKILDEESGKIYRGKYLSDVFVPEKTPFCREDIPQYIFNFGSNNPWNKMFRRAFVEEHALRFQPLRQTNDAYFVMMALFYARRITYVRDWLMIYRKGNHASLTGQTSKNRSCMSQALRAVYASLTQSGAFSEEIRRSFVNKALGMMLYSLRNQSDVQTYKELYSLYTGTMFEELGIAGHDRSYIYSEQMQRDYEIMQAAPAEEFLLHDLLNYSRRAALYGGRLRDTARKLSETREKLSETREKLSDTKAELAQSRREAKATARQLREVEESTSYKVGRKVTFIPRTLKEGLKNKGTKELPDQGQKAVSRKKADPEDGMQEKGGS